MKKISFVLVFVLLLTMMVSSVAFAAGGMPAAHGVDGKTFGAAVSGLAQTDPGALADHVSSLSATGSGGMPAAHGVDGKTFGAVVSWLAQADPGALAAHVSGCR
jgi:hypothetical protein